MARATAHPDHRCISSEDIHGTTVYGADGSNIGEIDHLIIDKLSGRVASWVRHVESDSPPSGNRPRVTISGTRYKPVSGSRMIASKATRK